MRFHLLRVIGHHQLGAWLVFLFQQPSRLVIDNAVAVRESHTVGFCSVCGHCSQSDSSQRLHQPFHELVIYEQCRKQREP